MSRLEISEDYLPTVGVARKIINQNRPYGAAIELKSGEIIGGRSSKWLRAEAAVMLNAVKVLAGIDDKYHLISPSVIAEINKINRKIGSHSESLDAAETMLAWAVSARDNPLAKKAVNYIGELRGCFVHTTHQPSAADLVFFRKLGLWLSTDGEIS